MATHSSVLAWKITWMEEPGGSQSMRIQQRIRHNRVTEYIPILPKQIRRHLNQTEEKEIAEDEVLGW